jgi:flagellar hook-length control protein FliK
LHNALSHSGLFYESHQAQWIAGMRSIPQLMQEPQNQLATRPVSTVNLGDPVSANITQNITPNSAPVIPQHLQNLVQQQLHTLENRQVLWQGLAWQGQEMRWEVREESPRRHANGEQEGQWITELNLDLPRLGNVSAKLSFNGNAVSIDFGVNDEQTRSTLGNASAQLVATLSERGIPVLQTRIKRTPGEPA